MSRSENPVPPNSNRNARSYWKANLCVVGVLLTIWFIAGYGISILFIEQFNTIQIGSVGLGFWFAQQGSIFVFAGLVLVYAVVMDVIDRNFHRGERS